MKFKDWLKNERLNRGLSQEVLAEELKVSYTTINFWENGRSVPSILNCANMSRFFNVEISFIRGMLKNED